jgi:hypothetical protein
MKIKCICAALLTVFGSFSARASEAPGWDETDAVVPKTTVAVVGTLVSRVSTNEPGNRVLIVSISPLRTIWGQEQANHLHVAYKEFIPVFPENMRVYYGNYTGSGIEWKAQTNSLYVFFLSQDANAMSLLRMEPAESEAKIREMFEKQKIAVSRLHQVEVKVGMERQKVEDQIAALLARTTKYSPYGNNLLGGIVEYRDGDWILRVTYKAGAPAPWVKSSDGAMQHLPPMDETVVEYKIERIPNQVPEAMAHKLADPQH